MNEKSNRWIALFLLSIDAVGALLGGWGLMLNPRSIPVEWLNHTPFHDYFIPGAILFLVVGGTSLFGAICLLFKTKHRWNFAFFAGVVLVGWITIELMLIRQFSWLQVVFGAIGLVVTYVAWASISLSNSERSKIVH